MYLAVMKYIRIITLLALVFALGACAPGSETGLPDQAANNGPMPEGVSGTGLVSINLTDAPIDDAAEVVVQFSAIDITSNDPDLNKNIVFAAPKSIDLLTLQGSNVQPLLIDEPLPAGEYSGFRLIVDDVEGERDSYIVLDAGGGEFELTVPSGSESGLKSNEAFTVVDGLRVNFTVDFDVRKSIVRTGNPRNPRTVKYLLKPQLRVVQDNTVGNITGKVAPDLLNNPICSDAITDTFNAVYVFSGSGVTPDDIDGDAVEPVSTSLVTLDDQTGDFRYEVGFLPAGDYTVSFTCNADAEIVDAEEGEIDNDLKFLGTRTTSVVAGQTTPDVDLE